MMMRVVLSADITPSRDAGALVAAIIARLEKKGDGHQDRWDKVWDDPLCQKYRRPEHEDFWLWNYDFFNAPVADLRHIARKAAHGAAFLYCL